VSERLEEVDLWVKEGFPINRVTAAIGVNRSLYYHHKQPDELEKGTPVKRGRPYPGFSETVSGKKVADEQMEEWLMEAVEGEKGIYGYKKLKLKLFHLIKFSSLLLLTLFMKQRS
jgi:hypothetical protein